MNGPVPVGSAASNTAACDSNRYHNEGFYCADANGVIVNESYCDGSRGYGGTPYYIWHSPSYVGGYAIGSRLPAAASCARAGASMTGPRSSP